MFKLERILLKEPVSCKIISIKHPCLISRTISTLNKKRYAFDQKEINYVNL